MVAPSRLTLVESGSVEAASSAGKIDMFDWKNTEFPLDGDAAK